MTCHAAAQWRAATDKYVLGFRALSESSSRPSSVRMAIRGDRIGMATKAALEPSQLETHITSLMRASFGRLKVVTITINNIETFSSISMAGPYLII